MNTMREALEKSGIAELELIFRRARDVAGELFEGQRRSRSSAANVCILIGCGGDTTEPDVGLLKNCDGGYPRVGPANRNPFL